MGGERGHRAGRALRRRRPLRPAGRDAARQPRAGDRPRLRELLPRRHGAGRRHRQRHARRPRPRGELPGAARAPRRRGRHRPLPRRVRPPGRSPPAADPRGRRPARPAGAAAERGPVLLQPGGVERHHAAHELGLDRRPRALDPARPRHRPRERRHRLALPAGRRGEDPPAQRPERRARHAAPGPHPRPAVPRAEPRRRPERQPGLEGHDARAGGVDGRPAAGALESGALDATLPHRRAPRGGDEDGLRRGGRPAARDVR